MTASLPEGITQGAFDTQFPIACGCRGPKYSPMWRWISYPCADDPRSFQNACADAGERRLKNFQINLVIPDGLAGAVRVVTTIQNGATFWNDVFFNIK